MENPYACQLAEDLLRSAPSQPQQHLHRESGTQLVNNRTSTLSISPPLPLVPLLPNNAVVFQSCRSPQEWDSSFLNYIDRHFQQDAIALKRHLETNSNDSNKFVDTEKQLAVDEPYTLWMVLQPDLDRFQGKDNSWTSDDGQRSWSDGGGIVLLFVFGFIFPPLWWLGSFWPRQPRGKMTTRWQQLNRYFSIGFSIILVIAIIVFAAFYGASH